MIPITKLTGRLGNQMFQFAYLYSKMKDKELPDFYLQDEKYFANHTEDIKRIFGEGTSFMPYGAIHLRRGDYVNNPFYVDLSKTDYYQKAVDMFPGKKWLVFSDDTEFAKEFFPDKEKYEIVEGNDEITDFNLMASCDVNIIANSTFSWWAAYVNPNPERKVVAPKDWFTDGVERITFPKEWTRI